MQEKVKNVFKIVLVAFVVITALYFWTEKVLYFFSEEEDLSWLPCYENGDLAIIEVKGEIVPYILESDNDENPKDSASSEDITYCLNRAKLNSEISAVVFEINSRGGSPVASEEIMYAIKRLHKPSVAIIRESGISGAYLIASATNRIFASELSDIGGIAATASYLDYSGKNIKEGITYQQISSGKFKDAGDPDKPLTIEEKELFARDIMILHEAFIKNVSKNRKLDIEKVKLLADGSSMLGMAAKESGLIDEIGSREEAENWLNAQEF